jgi:hypothetical protein
MSTEKIDRFTLEQDIMECWGVVDDIKVLTGNSSLMNDPQRMDNALNAITVLYQLKFEKLFNTFETLVHERDI